LGGAEKNWLDIRSGSEKSRFATAGAQNDVPLPLHMLVVKLSTGQWLYQNLVFMFNKHCSDVQMT